MTGIEKLSLEETARQMAETAEDWSEWDVTIGDGLDSHTWTMIRSATDADSAAIADIYNYYVTNSVVTFEEEPVAETEIAHRIAVVRAAGLPWLVADENEQLVGYAYATPWKERIGYRFSVETTIYLANGAARRGIGSKLYAELFRILEASGIKSAIGGIALPNDASVALHEKMGMKKVAEFERVGVKFGQWLNVGYWQRSFDEPVQ